MARGFEGTERVAPRHAYGATRNLASPDATHGLVPVVVRTHFTGTSTSALILQ